MSDSFAIPERRQRFELEIKRSQFITTVIPTRGAEAAHQSIAELRQEFPDANHHCWAFVAGTPDDVFQVDKSDDGEPRGTAGKPMLNVLQHSGLGFTTVVVTRYFGGVKLGAGGLVRAYTQCVSNALQSLETKQHWLTDSLEVTLPYAELARVEYWLKDTQIEITDRDFSSDIVLTLDVPRSATKKRMTELEKLGEGRFVLALLDED